MARPNIADQIKSLAGNLEAGDPATSTDVFENEEPRATKLRLADIEPDPDQSRVAPGDVSDLVSSIKEHGLLQPLIVSPRDRSGKYRIIAGERRYTACHLVGVKVVDAIIRTDRDQNRLEIQLIENLHRKDLDPFEEAAGYQRLVNEFSLTQQKLADRFGKSRTYITKLLALSAIPSSIRERCSHANIPLSRETLYLIATQPNKERMLQVFNDSQVQNLPREERRERARTGKTRPSADSPRKPKAVYTTDHHAVVIVQSLTTDELKHVQRLAALKQALREEKRRH